MQAMRCKLPAEFVKAITCRIVGLAFLNDPFLLLDSPNPKYYDP